jgi:hypothetical protein
VLALVLGLLQAGMVVRVDTGARILVGDPVSVAVRVRLPGGGSLLDLVPRTRDTLATGVRVLSADTLRQVGGEFVGRVRFAFFRTDSQAVPGLAVAYRRGDAIDTVFSAPVGIMVQHVVPTANATLRDIRDIETPVIPWWGIIATFCFALASLALLRLRASRSPRVVGDARGPGLDSGLGDGPFEAALAELAAIEHSGWDSSLQVAAAADVVRGYLERARGLPALERTTPEVRALVGADGLLGGADVEPLVLLLTDADLVKFARRRGDVGFVERARAVLRELAA